MKKLIFVAFMSVVMLMVLSSVVSCGSADKKESLSNSESENSPDKEDTDGGKASKKKVEDSESSFAGIPRLSLNNPKALFLGKKGNGGLSLTGGFGLLAGEEETGIKELTSEDEVEDAEFEDDVGEPLPTTSIVTVKKLASLNNDFIGVQLDYTFFYRNYFPILHLAGLIRVSDGTLYVLGETTPDSLSSILGIGDLPTDFTLDDTQIKGNYFYNYRAGSLYKTDLTTMTTEAVNLGGWSSLGLGATVASTYIGIGEISNKRSEFLVGNDGLILTQVTGNLVILHPDGSAPSMLGVGETCGMSSTAVYGEDGYIYAGFDYLTIKKITLSANSCSVETTNISDDVHLPINANTTYTFEDRNRYLLYDNGFRKMSPVPNGGISLTWTAKDLTSIWTTQQATGAASKVTISANYVYWKDGTTLKRIELSAGGVEETMIADTTGVTNINFVAGSIIYTTASGTFQLNNAGDTPLHISSVDLGVEQLVEFNLE